MIQTGWDQHIVHKQRSQRLDQLLTKISKKKIQKTKPISYNKVLYDSKFRSIGSLDQLVLTILSLDQRIAKQVNLFPLQLKELQSHLPCKQLRPLLKMLNTLIDSSLKQIKEDDSNWSQIAIKNLILLDQEWKRRWDIVEYRSIVEERNPNLMKSKIDEILIRNGIRCEQIFIRGLVLRYLMDISED